MKSKIWLALVAKYRAALAAYVARGTEEELQRSYEVGRRALEIGYGVLDMVRLHHEAAARFGGPDAATREQRAAEAFLMEALSPFEVAQRGFRETSERLSRINDTIAQRNRELATANERLEREVLRRQNAQDALEESELKFRSVVESAQDGIVTVDRRGRLVSLNHGAETMFGYRREELLGKSVTRLIPKPLRATAEYALQCLAGGTEQQLLKRPIESCGLHRDGTEFSLELTLATWRTGGEIFFTGVVRDIRERKQAELALRESREHYIKLFNEARAMEENLRRLSSQVITAQEEERKHISRELHDEIAQVLTAANVSIALLREPAARNEDFRKKVEDAQRLIEESMEMVHRFARELRPSMLDHLGPYAALQNYVKSFSERTGIRTELQNSAQLERLDQQQGTVLYRVAQESLTNAFKHARATRVKIRLRQLPRAVCMEIIDNGRSFKVPRLGAAPNGEEPQRLGLLGMQERVRLVNGQFAIQSAPRRGTTVRVEIPFSSPSHSRSGTGKDCLELIPTHHHE
ncbi:MAG TPA: PAS domain S-box protein [Opitutaceae bacterium]|nr:PAS domain S-box protein [Opitutaceae bacterium]